MLCVSVVAVCLSTTKNYLAVWNSKSNRGRPSIDDVATREKEDRNVLSHVASRLAQFASFELMQYALWEQWMMKRIVTC
jgi:hypothetical protein